MSELNNTNFPPPPLGQSKPAQPVGAPEVSQTDLFQIARREPVVRSAPTRGGKTVPIKGLVLSHARLVEDLETQLLKHAQATLPSPHYSWRAPMRRAAAAEDVRPAAKQITAPSPAKSQPAGSAPQPLVARAMAAPSASSPGKPASHPQDRIGAAPQRSEKVMVAISLSPAARHTQGTYPAALRPVGRLANVAARTAEPIKPALARAPSHPTAGPHVSDGAGAKSSVRVKNLAVESRPAPEPSCLPLAVPPKPPLVAPNAEPQKSELPVLPPLGGAPEGDSGENALSLPDQRDTLARYDEEDGASRLGHALDYEEYRPEHRRLIGHVVVLGTVLVVAAGLPYVLMRSEKPLVVSPIATKESAGTIGSMGDSEGRKLIQDPIVGAVSAKETTKLVTPGHEKVGVRAGAAFGGINPGSRINPLGSPLDPPASPLATDKAASSDGKLSPAELADPQIVVLSLLTKLGYFSPLDADEDGGAALKRAFTTWLFRHELPANTPLTGELIQKMSADLAAGHLSSAAGSR